MALRLSVFTHSPYPWNDSVSTQKAAGSLSKFKPSDKIEYTVKNGKIDPYIHVAFNRDPLWPMLLGIVYSFTGPGYSISYFLSALFSSIVIFTLFFISYLLFRRKDIGIYAAFIFAISINHVFWASNDSNVTTSVLFVSIFILSYLYYDKKQDKKSLYLALSALSVCAVSRPENILFIPFFILYEILKKRKVKWDILLIIFTIIISFLIIPKIGLFLKDGSHQFDREDSIFNIEDTLHYSLHNFKKFSFSLLNKEFQPYVIGFMAILGIVSAFINEKKKARFLIVWLLVIFLPFMSSFVVATEDINIHRLFLTSHLPLVIFSAYGIYYLTKKADRKMILICIFLLCVPYVNTYRIHMQKNQAQIDFSKFRFEIIPERMEKTNLKDCFFLVKDHNPYSDIYTKIRPFKMGWALENKEEIDTFIKKGDCFIYGKFHNTPDNDKKIILERFEIKKVYNTSYRGESFVAYNLTGIKEEK